jgi:hypothetical protein
LENSDRRSFVGARLLLARDTAVQTRSRDELAWREEDWAPQNLEERRADKEPKPVCETSRDENGEQRPENRNCDAEDSSLAELTGDRRFTGELMRDNR